MDLSDPNRFQNRKPTPSERFLGVPSHAPLNTATPEELDEDDVVFFSTDYFAEPNYSSSSTPSSSSSATPNHHNHHHHHKGFGFAPPDSFGILAALPENDTRNVSQFFHKASVSSSSFSSASSSSSSAARLIPTIPRPPPQHDRVMTPSSSINLRHQSAPVNIPTLSEAMMKARRRHREFDEVDGDDDMEDDGEMLPPHEIVARNSARSPALACSVLEGVGRTLKGRDLRQVRNAIWRQTGFLD